MSHEPFCPRVVSAQCVEPFGHLPSIRGNGNAASRQRVPCMHGFPPDGHSNNPMLVLLIVSCMPCNHCDPRDLGPNWHPTKHISCLCNHTTLGMYVSNRAPLITISLAIPYLEILSWTLSPHGHYFNCCICCPNTPVGYSISKDALILHLYKAIWSIINHASLGHYLL